VAIVFDEKTVGVWYLKPAPDMDWLASVREIEPQAVYEFKYRFRYYKDEHAFDSKDRRNWYEGSIYGTRSFVIAGIRQAAKTLLQSGESYYELLNDGDIDAFFRRFQDAPFVFARMETKVHREEGK
jgi:hypothetical protein